MKEETYRLWSIVLQGLTLAVVCVIGVFVERAIAREGVAAAYVDVAASILLDKSVTKDNDENGLRCWALALLVEYTPEAAPIPDKLRKAMLEGRVIGLQPVGRQPKGIEPAGIESQTAIDPECKLPS